MAITLDERSAVLHSLGATAGETEELLRYTTNLFCVPEPAVDEFPLVDEPFVEAWRFYASEIERAGSFSAIYPYFPQLQFPVCEGISKQKQYTKAVLSGEFSYPDGIATGLPLEQPELCKLRIQPTPAGSIPVIFAATRPDFLSLLRAFARKGEPDPIPDSMGAVIIAGYNNFHRIHLLRDAFLQDAPIEAWPPEFMRIREHKQLYQDRFILLSPSPYSGVSAASMGLEQEQWIAFSVAIRMEHECTHYFTRRIFNSMRNNLLDELLADYLGIVAAHGTYNTNWALQFLGWDRELTYRPGGRIENYRGTPALSAGAFQVLVRLVPEAVAGLAELSKAAASYAADSAVKAATIYSISSLALEELTSITGRQTLLARFRHFLEAFQCSSTGVGTIPSSSIP